jgi:pyruvate/2-oxoglutarate dehydrogenase complex dihydrolipoamide acyltransferase (E2) component
MADASTPPSAPTAVSAAAALAASTPPAAAPAADPAAPAPAADPAAPAADAPKPEEPAGLKLPGEDAKPEEWDAFYKQLGRPEAADKYDIKYAETADPEFTKGVNALMFEAGLNNKQAQTIVAKYDAMVAEAVAKQETVKQAAYGEQAKALTAEWGQSFEANITVAAQAAKQFGFDAKTIDAIQSSIGYDGVMKLMHTIGSKLGEAQFVAGNNNKPTDQPKTLAERMYPNMKP